MSTTIKDPAFNYIFFRFGGAKGKQRNKERAKNKNNNNNKKQTRTEILYIESKKVRKLFLVSKCEMLFFLNKIRSARDRALK